MADSIIIDVNLSERSTEDDVAELSAGLTGTPRTLPTRYFYDDRGSELFERICELPEYYQTRTEEALLRSIADEVVARTGAHDLVELGSGAATKTRVVLDAMQRAGTLRRYVPFDVSEGIVRRVADELVEEYPGLEVHGVVGNFLEHLDGIPEGSDRLVLFLGGTIGNLPPRPEARTFLRSLDEAMDPGDWLLLGTDLIKPVQRVERAYNDRAGVTARFNLNILDVVNRQFGTDFAPRLFRHLAFYNEVDRRIEMWLISSVPQRIAIPSAQVDVELAAGEGLRTEISTKYDRPRVESLLDDTGFDLVHWYTDPEKLFALSLARRR